MDKWYNLLLSVILERQFSFLPLVKMDTFVELFHDRVSSPSEAATSAEKASSRSRCFQREMKTSTIMGEQSFSQNNVSLVPLSFKSKNAQKKYKYGTYAVLKQTFSIERSISEKLKMRKIFLL